MPDTCTCGAQLPPDAVFCHKCGKPQREIAPSEPEVLETFTPVSVSPQNEAYAQPAEPPQDRELPPPTFRNPVALRIALLVGVAGTFMGWLPLLNWLGAGFFAVFFYRRKTKSVLSVNAGMRLGWITGVIMFSIWSILLAILKAGGQLTEMFQEQMRSLPANDPYVQQLAGFLESFPGLFVMLLFGFILITCFSVAGGALGAKLGGRS